MTLLRSAVNDSPTPPVATRFAATPASFSVFLMTNSLAEPAAENPIFLPASSLTSFAPPAFFETTTIVVEPKPPPMMRIGWP